jgi:hypothetical protein
MKNIPLIVYLGKNLTEYAQQTADVRTLTQQVNQHFPADQLEGHKSECQLEANSSLAYHGSYLRTKIVDTEGQIHQAKIHRLYCPKCRQTWTVYPSILVPGKHYDSYVVQNTLENTLSYEQSYRAVTRQQAQLTSSGAPRPNGFEHARTPWNWVVWLGQFSLPLVLLACGLTPPRYAVEDEKFLRQNRQKSYAVGLVDHRTDLLWWLDYVFATDQQSLQTSFATLANLLKLIDPTHYFEGITGDSWVAAKKAFAALDSRTKLAECLLHPMLKFEQEVARYIRQEHLPKEVAQLLIEAFWQILLAPDQASWENNLAELANWEDFEHPILAERLASLERKKEGLCLRFSDPNLAPSSNAIDRVFKRFERKFSSMQQFRTNESGRATLNAWGIVYDFRRYGHAAKRADQSPAELAGAKLEGIPWLQYILIQLSKVRWLKSASALFHNLCGL